MLVGVKRILYKWEFQNVFWGPRASFIFLEMDNCVSVFFFTTVQQAGSSASSKRGRALTSLEATRLGLEAARVGLEAAVVRLECVFTQVPAPGSGPSSEKSKW